MIAADSDALAVALDRRMQVARVAAPDAPKPVADGPDDAAARPRADPTPATRLPLGATVTALVVGVSEAGDAIAEVAGLRVALSWRGVGPVPAPGARIALRVLAHAPTLLFESVASEAETDPALHLSVAARTLQAPAANGAGPLRFTAPILSFDDAVPGSTRVASDAQGVASDAAARSAALPLLLLGPAWPGQDVELVVRRERSDEAFDNAALDRWCGAFVVDLPTLGRVSSHLSWSIRGLRVRVAGHDDASVACLTASAAELAAALSDAALPVVALTVGGPIVDATQVDRV